jgi:hypothetical protein
MDCEEIVCDDVDVAQDRALVWGSCIIMFQKKAKIFLIIWTATNTVSLRKAVCSATAIWNHYPQRLRRARIGQCIGSCCHQHINGNRE